MKWIQVGAGPGASQYLTLAAKARAELPKADSVLWLDYDNAPMPYSVQLAGAG